MVSMSSHTPSLSFGDPSASHEIIRASVLPTASGSSEVPFFSEGNMTVNCQMNTGCSDEHWRFLAQLPRFRFNMLLIASTETQRSASIWEARSCSRLAYLGIGCPQFHTVYYIYTVNIYIYFILYNQKQGEPADPKAKRSAQPRKNKQTQISRPKRSISPLQASWQL